MNIALDVDRPYLRNDYVVQRYGGHSQRWWENDRDHGHGHHGKDHHDGH